MNAIDLKQRNAIVTGGAQGIGRAVAERLLQSGARVVLWDKDSDLVSETARTLAGQGEASAQVVDVTDAGGVAAAFASAVDAHGTIDIMVNNAGIAGPTMPVLGVSDRGVADRRRRGSERRLLLLPRRAAPHARA